MMSGINEIAVGNICPACAVDMEQDYVMLNMGRLGADTCERCGRKTLTMIYRYTLRGNEYDRRGIEMVFD